MIRYKLTDQAMQTYNGFQWELGKTYTTSGEGKLCTKGWLHVYDSPELAAFLNPIHADIKDPRLFECECSGKTKDDNGLKRGYSSVTLTKELPLPVITITQRVAFGIMCAKVVCTNEKWLKWADDWLSGKDRSAAAAAAAAAAARAAYAAAAKAAKAAAAAAAAAAARAAAVEWAEEAAWAAAWAAAAAAEEAKIDLVAIAKKASLFGRSRAMKIICWFFKHKPHELYDPDDKYVNKWMCTRCLKFWR